MRSTPPRRPAAMRIAAWMFVLLALGALARLVRYALNFPLWGDEAFVAVDFLTRDFRGLLAPLTYGQVVPLLYTWATLAISRVLGTSEYALRLLPLIAALASLPLFWWFVASQLRRGAALLAVGFLAAAYYPIRHGAEVKPYSTDLFIALLLTVLAWSVYQHSRSVVRWTALILAAAVAVWASYPAIFVAGGIGLLLGLLLLERGRRGYAVPMFAGGLLYAAVVTGSFAWMYVAYGHPHADYASHTKDIPMWTEAFPPLTQPLKLLGWFFTTHAGLMLAYPNGGRNGGSIATLVCVAAGIYFLWRTNRPLLLLLLGPLPFNFVAAALERYPYGQTARVSLYLAPAVCLLAGVGLATLLRALVPASRRFAAFQIAAGVLAAFAVGSIVMDVMQPYKKQANFANRRVIRDLAAHSTPADRWIMFNALTPVDYAPYIASWKGDGAQLIFYSTRLSPAPITWAPRPEEVEPHKAGMTWLIVYRGANFKLFSQEQCDRYVAAVSARLGTPKLQTYVLQERAGVQIQALDVFEFPAGPGDTRAESQ